MKRLALILLPLLAFATGAATMAGWNDAQARRAAARPAPALDGARMFAPSPESPAETSSSGDDDTSSSPLSSANWPDNAPSPEQVIYAQSDLLARETARLRPRTAGKVNLYAIVFAGDGSQNVFRNEAEYFDKLFSKRLGAAGHVVVLENNPASLTTRPLATWSNLEDALDAIAAKMDPQQDILLLYFTTHGSEDHTLLVDMDPLPLDQIGASDLPGILAEHPFKYKVVIVNACYSGGFIPPLKNPDTMIVTAARADRSSFGCGEQSELTWFGHAFLVDALNKTGDFRQAFQLARTQVAAWEKRDNYEPSEPQISTGGGITAELAKWRKGFTPGAAVPFAPAAASSTGSTQ
ncbi:MAG TPA: C13 family peptidase [Rhodanobacteraceae bacterium]|nr:C13 family peptidase [Rhodanobacteraceae bacterium]